MFVHFVLGWDANFVGIVKGGRVAKCLRTPVLDVGTGAKKFRCPELEI